MKSHSALFLVFFLCAHASSFAQQPSDVFVNDVPATLTPIPPPATPTVSPVPNLVPIAPTVPTVPTFEPVVVPAIAQVRIASVPSLATDQFVRICTNTADPADCGKKVEVEQFKRAGGAANALARRDGKLLAITVPGEPPFIFEDIDSEAGPNTSFSSYNAIADSVVLYRARADKIEYILVHRTTGTTTEIPNEPKFNSDGRYFVTADFCKEGCENRITLWRMERRGPTRERVFAPRSAWADADVTWGTPRRLIVDVTENGKSVAINLDINDPRWNVLLP
jgi:hypothetical protein